MDDLGIPLHGLARERCLDVGTHALQALGPHDLEDRVPDDLVARDPEPFRVALADPQVAHRRAALGNRDGQCAEDLVCPSKDIRGGAGSPMTLTKN